MTEPVFSVIVPVFDEEPVIARTAARLLEGLPETGAEVVWVCNGCSDRSREILERVTGGRFPVLELAQRSKTAAIREGERRVTCFPRFYVDSDVEVTGAALVALARRLSQGSLELVAPRIVLDDTGASRAARAVSAVWSALPHREREGFHHVLGVSEAGRRRWDEMPELLADDAYIAARIPAARRAIVREAEVRVRPPRTLAAWIGVRARWARGHDELKRLGHPVPRTRSQRRALLRMLASPRWTASALVYVFTVLAARVAAGASRGWFRDATSRVAADARPPNPSTRPPVPPPAHSGQAPRGRGGSGCA